MDGGARRRRRDSMDSKGFAPVSTAIAGTALARLGILTLDGPLFHSVGLEACRNKSCLA